MAAMPWEFFYFKEIFISPFTQIPKKPLPAIKHKNEIRVKLLYLIVTYFKIKYTIVKKIVISLATLKYLL